MVKEPIIIVGAGPVGLTAAEILGTAGIPVVVLEKGHTPNQEWRASTFHAATLELLEETGLTPELLKHGLKAETIQYRDRTTGLFAEFDCRLIADETRYPFRLQCPQSTYTRVVHERTKDNPRVTVLFDRRVDTVSQDAEGVTVHVTNESGGHETFRGSYVLGADGARSTVRRSLGYSFDGYTLEERFLLVGTPVSFEKYIPDLAYVNYLSDPEEFLFILRVPEAWRLLYPVPPSVTDAAALNPERLQSQLQKALNTQDEFPIVEHMIYRVHQRVATSFYKGRVILMGDAAHVNSPLGGLGLNSGIHDAVDLARRFTRIVDYDDQERVEEELNMYAETRRFVALAYVRQISKRNTNVLTERDPVRRVELQREMADEARDPARARQWLLRSTLLSAVRDQGIGRAPEHRR
ncbi:FAD-dependent oxidoreductase [Sulfobacillus harzensis]|uniref:FAD-dependent monooxygenase n=1 Tax=Sulfobacillus harzensis TaxID=2729629 RepID=A0A7Y0L6B1_9FIRM|nr:NAD(P)/FAD-dependent oxidoreductase [Sulfobacillus harzensis]NMP24128.1 FAD-dependent monooxygenase [Sulfobacillus harzensis]